MIPVLEIDEDTLRALIVLKDHKLYPVVVNWLTKEYEKFKVEISTSWDIPEYQMRAFQGMTDILGKLELIFRDPKTGLEYKLSRAEAKKSKLPPI